MRAPTTLALALVLAACDGTPPVDDTDPGTDTATEAALPTPFPVVWDAAHVIPREEATVTVAGLSIQLNLFENSTYRCSGSGNYKFMVATPAGTTGDAPLWVLLGGGTPGHFDAACEGDPASPDCSYHPLSGADHIDTADINTLKSQLMTHLKGDFMGNSFKNNIAANRAQAGDRFLVVSGCDDDLFSGLGDVDPSNPARGLTADGFLATAAAIDFTVHHASYPSTQVFLHGTSGGGAGAFTVARGLFEHDIRVNGVIADSYLLNDSLLALDERRCVDDNQTDSRYSLAAVGDKIGFFAEREDFFPRGSYDQGYDVPLYDIFSLRDGACCGTAPLVDGAGGNRSNCAFVHRGVTDLVDAGTPGVAQWVDDSGEHALTISNNQPELANALNLWVQGILDSGVAGPTWPDTP